MIKYISAILFIMILNHPKVDRNKDVKPYLALGDSYTIGESVSQSQSFPYQLANAFSKVEMHVSPQIIAKTGWTTGDLLQAIARENPHQSYEFVTLLIGVNNQYRGYSKETYRKEFKELLQISIRSAGNRKEHVFVISIPDWGVTDYARENGFNEQTVSKEIDVFNVINKEETLAMGISYTDITAQSRLAKTDKSLIANDGLHPSEKMYAHWVNVLFPKIKAIVKN